MHRPLWESLDVFCSWYPIPGDGNSDNHDDHAALFTLSTPVVRRLACLCQGEHEVQDEKPVHVQDKAIETVIVSIRN
jgi:hypothetical protein